MAPCRHRALQASRAPRTIGRQTHRFSSVKIHPLAVVSPAAKLGHGVRIGPFCVVEPDATIGDGCCLESHVIVKTGATLGRDNHIFEGAVIGGLPQHLKKDAPGVLEIGEGNTIRENVTIHRSIQPGQATRIGDGNLLMVNVHVAHDCLIGDHAVFTNNVMLAGHVVVEDQAYLAGAAASHQFCRIGRLAMIGGQARVIKDVPPYVTVDGGSGCIVGLNLIGLRRAGFDRNDIKEFKAAYRLIYRSGLAWNQIMERLAVEFPQGPAAKFHEFFSGGVRGFTPARRPPAGSTLQLRNDNEGLAKAG